MISCFPFVIQEDWSSTRENGRIGQHFDLTQDPSDIEVDQYGFSPNYLVAIIFEIGEKKWARDTIMKLVIVILREMDIELGEDIRVIR